MIKPDSASDPLVSVVGMDVLDGILGGPVQIDAYGPDETLLGSFTVHPPGKGLTEFAGMISTAPISRRQELSFGKAPTLRVRFLISFIIRSSMFVELSFRRSRRGSARWPV